MKTPNEIAQWVIDNRYPKGKNQKISDAEMYHELIINIEKLYNKSPVIRCTTCKYDQLSKLAEPCYLCIKHSHYQNK